MAFGKVKESTESVEYKKYIGVAPCHVLALNPTKDELSAIYGREMTKEPEYLMESELGEKKTIVQTAKLDFIVVADPEKCIGPDGPIDFKTKVTLFISNAYRFNRDQTKAQVIDKYGRTAWVTPEQHEKHEIPVYSNGMPANIDADYRLAYIGEEALTNFLIAYLNIASCQKYINGAWEMNDAKDLPDSEARLDNITKLFKGDFSEIKSIVKMGMDLNNKIKILFGIKSGDNGAMYESPYTGMFLKNNTSNYDRLQKNILAAKEAGGLSNIEFDVNDLHEYKVEATNFNAPNTDAAKDLPFGPAPLETLSPWGK